jgi:uncharacterized membrane protein YdjX (TVP38/TMEM64 family)
VSWTVLAAGTGGLRAAIEARPVLAPIGYVLIYVVVTALSIPQASVLSIVGGALFGPVRATVLIVAGASVGATLLFLAARTALAGPVRARAAPLLDRVRPGLERDGFNYLLSLRLLPAVPFWLLNLAPPLVGMRLGPFVAATVIGIIPGTFVFASLGAGLGAVFDRGEKPDLGLIFEPRVILPILALALLSLVPALYRRFRKR